MVRRGHRLLGLVVALCVSVGTLTACGAMSEDRQIITADEIAQQESAKAERQEALQETPPEQPQAQDEQKQPKKRKKQKPAPALSTSTNADLDAYVGRAEELFHETLGEAFTKLYSSIDIVPVYPSSIEFVYTLRVAVDPAAAQAGMDAQAPTLRTHVRTVVVPEMTGLGFADPTVTFTYRNPDGSIVWSRTFP